jgi:uncharacterized damage-inducible protein DinB
MNVKDALRNNLLLTRNLLTQALSDLSDADLLVRPVPGANHIAWQLGHVVNSERGMISKNVPNQAYPELPAGFAERHNKESATSQDTKGWGTKAEYLALFNKVRDTTIAALDRIPETDLDKPVEGPAARMAPTVGALFALASNHALMHTGQFSVVRRKLTKPILM